MEPASSNALEPPSKKLRKDEGKTARDTTMPNDSPFPSEPLKRQHTTISLLPVEQLLRQLLLDYRDEILGDSASSKLDIWFTGGWVRDKLLGIQTMDIDAALSTMTGMQFGKDLEKFYSRNRANYVQEAKRLCVSPEFKLHMVGRKPEKSKHLETGTVHIFDLDVDFVNLRGETYTEDSRNPQVVFATAEEDALRRDATVNALFYNVDSQQLEDFTGKGLQDMAAGIMRTPLDPHQTFLDDPLRVLRLIRFASRLGYKIEDEVMQSMKDERIHASLNAKISRERVGIEVFKMINGRNPLMAFQLIYDAGLYSTVFLKSSSQSLHSLTNMLPDRQPGLPWPTTWPRAYHVLADLLRETSILGNLTQPEESGENAWLMAAYAPIAILRQRERKQAVKDATSAMKLTHTASKLVEDGLKHMNEIQSNADLVAAYDHSSGTLVRMFLLPNAYCCCL